MFLSSRLRVPTIRQTEAAECGLACLAMIASSHGHNVELSALRARFPVTLKGLSLTRLIDIASGLALEARPLKIELEHLRHLRGPAILHWDMKHFVVLERVRGNRLVVIDPAAGRRTMSLADVSNHFTGVVLELSPRSEFVRKPRPKRISIARMIGPVSGAMASIAWIFALSVLLQAFGLLAPLQMQWTVDQALLEWNGDLLAVIGVGFGLLVVTQAVTAALRSWSVLYLSTMLSAQWVSSVFSHMTRLPLEYFGKRHLGDVVSRFGSIHAIETTLSSTFVEGLIDGLMVAATAALMIYYSGYLFLLPLLAVLAYLALRLAFYRHYRDNSEDRLNREAKQNTHFLETIRGIQSVKVNGKETVRRAGWQNLMVDTMNANLAGARLTLGFSTSSQIIFGFERVLVIWLGASLVSSGSLTLGMLFAFMSFKEQFSGRVKTLIDRIIEVRMLSLHAERLSDIVMTEVEPAPTGMTNDEFTGTLSVRDLAFEYAPGEPAVLTGCNLDVRDGESIAIVGPSGCGKTTLMKLLLGLLTPNRGTIEWGGTVMTGGAWIGFRRHVGVVMQDDQLFAGTIADNISFFDQDASLEAIHLAAVQAGIFDDIAAMPMGFNTLIGDMGSTLSGGQKQRVVLARAFYRRPKVLLLDEATSHLDTASESLVNAAIRSMRVTRIIIAHRRETILSADRVYRLESGRLAEVGKAELLNVAMPAYGSAEGCIA